MFFSEEEERPGSWCSGSSEGGRERSCACRTAKGLPGDAWDVVVEMRMSV